VAGTARLGGQPVARLTELQRAGLAGYLPQERRVAWNMPAWRIAALGAIAVAPEESRRRALAELEKIGLGELAERGVRDMSGGERARVLIARLFATEAPLLVADEPTAGLDPDAALRIMDALRRRADRGQAILVTLHDLTVAARGCNRLAVMSAGRVVALDAPHAALSPPVLARAFALEGGLVDTAAGLVLAARRRPQVPERTVL
jgi:iron complex transport system ATP-binding protein